MSEASQTELAALPGSAYAAELQRGAGSRPFCPSLEAEYSLQYLAENRTFVRATSVFAVVVAALRGTEQILAAAWNQWQLVQFSLVLASSLVLATVACGPWFERRYLPFARLLVPLRSALVAAVVASVAAQGQLEALMLLPLLVIGPFFVLGLRFRSALITVAFTIFVYAITAAALELELPLIVRTSMLLLIVAATCGVVALHLEKASRTRFLESHLIADLAQRDALTGLNNRRVFDEHFQKLWDQAVEESSVIAIVLIDVDHFKTYNDRYGHQAGDHALRRVAETLETSIVRPQDLLARYGGEEFAALLYDTDAVEAEAFAERMRMAISELALDHQGSRAGSGVTISAGVAVVEPSRERHLRGALQLADQALYQAKVSGRNRVEVFDQGEYEALQTGVFSKRSAGIG